MHLCKPSYSLSLAEPLEPDYVDAKCGHLVPFEATFDDHDKLRCKTCKQLNCQECLEWHKGNCAICDENPIKRSDEND